MDMPLTRDPAGDPGVKSIWEPYPGLRPFLDHEAELLFGRDEQVLQIIDRLERQQFVAVIGGSGSGKSSLVRAGVVPALRSWAIKKAGDCWIPMVCTPGSNAFDLGMPEKQYTPIRRFAWKFSRLLPGIEDAEEDDKRVEEIASLLRRDAGISRIVERYGAQLPSAPGLSSQETRVLFVIDQFEELFHPSNKTTTGDLIDDARLLIERVIDHFYGGHPQCYLVLTMRSEHLNDCAGFLELPDAINASSYLVRRLDDAQLQEAIVGPVRSFLAQRQNEPGHRGAAEAFVFDPDVLGRVLKDVKAIAHDQDHLPLLQHILSRAWDSAVARAGQTGGVPSRLDMHDLAVAALVNVDEPGKDLAQVGNLLRASLHHHAEAVYGQHHDDGERVALVDLLRRLAFKDPNTGMYSQQRVNIDDSNRDDLWSLVCNGLIGTVNYLHWDRENPQRVTLKVSHEAFIRGWPRFRELIDKEAENFDEFMQALRACQRWVSGGRNDKHLMETAQLRRLADACIDALLAEPHERARWLRLLSFVRDGRGLGKAVPDIDEFLARSKIAVHTHLEEEQARKQHLVDLQLKNQRDAAERAEAEKALVEERLKTEQIASAAKQLRIENAEALLRVAKADSERMHAESERANADRVVRRERIKRWSLTLFVLVLLPLAFYMLLVMAPTSERSKAYVNAILDMRAVDVGLFSANSAEALKREVPKAVKALETAELGRTGAFLRLEQKWSVSWLDSDEKSSVPWVKPVWQWLVGSERQRLHDVIKLVEPDIDGRFRHLMWGRLWPVDGLPPAGNLGAQSKPNQVCLPSSGESVTGDLFIAARRQGEERGRAVLVQVGHVGMFGEWNVYPATLEREPDGGEVCRIGPSIWRSPPVFSGESAQVALSPSLDHLLELGRRGSGTESSGVSVTTLELRWTGVHTDSEKTLMKSARLPSQLPFEWRVARSEGMRSNDRMLVEALGRTIGSQNGVLLKGAASLGGLTLNIDDKSWRILVASPVSVSFATLAVLKENANSPCGWLVNLIKQRYKDQWDLTSVQILPVLTRCMVVVRGRPKLDPQSVPDGRELVNVAMYLSPSSAPGNDDKLLPLVGLAFGEQAQGATDWTVIDSGDYAGWVAMRRTGADNVEGWLGMPLETRALVRIGCSFLAKNSTPGAGAASGSGECT